MKHRYSVRVKEVRCVEVSLKDAIKLGFGFGLGIFIWGLVLAGVALVLVSAAV